MRIENRPTRRRRNGLSIVEVIISTLLVGLVLVGAMKCVGASVSGRMGVCDQTRGSQLAQQLLTEILNTDYTDEGPAPVFGLETGETALDRLGFDDVDDFQGWSSTPPQDRDGTVILNGDGWQRDVTVEWVDPTNPNQASGSDQGLKRVTVTVRYQGTIVAENFALRSSEYSP